MAVMARRDPEATRKVVGIVLYTLLMLGGFGLLLLLFIVPAFLSKDPSLELEAMGLGALFALPALAIYLCLPSLLDRYDPEPWWALLMVLAWGGIAAVGFAGLINTIVIAVGSATMGKGAGAVLGMCVSAPIVEEFWKALAIFGIFYFAKREFDGVVDGIIYATFVALGFAAIENVVYYARAAMEEATKAQAHGAFAGTVFIRGVLSPWGHPLYTSMTGIGFGLAREKDGSWKWLGPIGGYFVAVLLHAIWNGAATISGMLVAVMLPLWLIVVIAFLCIWIWLVVRKGRIIREHLKDEVLLGNLTPYELELACSAFGKMKATFSYGGSAGRRFVKAAARLALSKWHTGRAMRGRKMTVSADFIVPLRQELHALRAEVSRAKGYQVPQPQAWHPGAYQPPQQQHGWQQQQQVPPQQYPPHGRRW